MITSDVIIDELIAIKDEYLYRTKIHPNKPMNIVIMMDTQAKILSKFLALADKVKVDHYGKET